MFSIVATYGLTYTVADINYYNNRWNLVLKLANLGIN